MNGSPSRWPTLVSRAWPTSRQGGNMAITDELVSYKTWIAKSLALVQTQLESCCFIGVHYSSLLVV